MTKLIFVLIFSITSLFASSYTLDKENSEVFYKANKSQFFMDIEVNAINKDLKASLEKIEVGKYRGVLKIDSSKFISDSDMRDSHVREDYLKSEEFPYIKFHYSVQDKKASGLMIITGTPKQIEFPVEINETEDSLHLVGEIKIKYSDFGIKTPSNLILSADEELVIGANLNFNK